MIMFNDKWVEDHVYDINTFIIASQDLMYTAYLSYFESYDGESQKVLLQQDLQGIINLFAPIIQLRIDLLDIEIRRQVAISYYEDTGNVNILRPVNEPMELIIIAMQQYAQSFLMSYDEMVNTLNNNLKEYLNGV